MIHSLRGLPASSPGSLFARQKRGATTRRGTTLEAIEGIFDWYWLGVVAGLGVAGGIAFGLRRVGVAGLAIALLAGAGIIAWTLPPLLGAAAFVVAAALGFLALRGLSSAAAPAAALAAAAVAFVPAAGYVAVVAAPLLGWRLRRRAAGRYAGLRVLARD